MKLRNALPYALIALCPLPLDLGAEVKTVTTRGFEGLAPAVDGVVTEQLNRLGSFLAEEEEGAG